MYHGVGRPDAGSVRKVAAVLSEGDTDVVWKLIGTGHADYGDFPLATIEDDLLLLTPKQRQSLIAIVKSMADPEGKRLGHVATPAEKKEDEVARRRAERERAGGKKRAARSRESDDPPKK
ncbi:hypothetical protein ASF35_02020 [Aeromicrobium sp. Leaf291]|nr:hypothetical protein ASF35_02020 [Aeromicrobium sp. Leaf291]